MIERIVVGVDPSNVAREVLRNAAAVAARLDAKLVLVGTVPTTDRGGASNSDADTDASADASADKDASAGADASAAPRDEGNDAPPALLALLARKALEACAEDLPAERVERTEVRSGPAWQALCHAAEEHGADLIIVDAEAFPGAGLPPSETAVQVAHHAPCSVLVVRGAARARHTNGARRERDASKRDSGENGAEPPDPVTRSPRRAAG